MRKYTSKKNFAIVGYTLIEVTVTASLVGIIALASMKGLQYVSEMKMKAEVSSEISFLQRELNDKLKINKPIVQVTGHTQPCTEIVPLQEISSQSNGQEFLLKGMTFAAMKKVSFSLEDVQELTRASTAKIYSALLRVSYTAIRSSHVVRRYVGVIYFKTDHANQVISCSSSPYL